jgi:glucose-6-phosphate 1-dehydrogenase
MTAQLRHPFLTGLSKHRGAPPTLIVIFGASGDLTRRKLIPAIYNLAVDNLLPSDFFLVGFGRKELSHDDFRDQARNALVDFSRRKLSNEIWERISGGIRYQAGSYDDPEAFDNLRKCIEEFEKQIERPLQLIFYISTPPNVFADVIRNLGRTGLAARSGNERTSRVIVEKPFGHDLESAQALNSTLRHEFDEDQVYRIDHYLGKETVQDLLVLRFANAIFEPIWNREFVDHVQITVSEELGVGSRGGYYDTSGALRDMIQNHTMQLLALTAMEPPVSLDPESIRDEKVKVLKAIQPLKLDLEKGDAVRAQYDEGLVSGQKVKGYRQEEGIPADSATETYAAVRLSLNNWRWKGVPFYLRSGKRMARRLSEIAIHFRRPPGILFSAGEQFNIAPNTLVIRIQPDEGITLLFNSKVPGLETRTQPVKMDFRHATTYGSNTPEAYERLILDAILGDSTLFIRGDETETSWKIFTPLLDSWAKAGRQGMESYVSGSWGPLAAERLLWEARHEWRRSGI